MWDIALDRETGDWIFAGNMDILTTNGDALTKQRMVTRLKIPRGSFVYDELGTLGSQLEVLTRYTYDRAANETPTLIREALAPMDDIDISNIVVSPSSSDVQGIEAVVNYKYALQTDEASADAPDDAEQQSVFIPL